MFISDQNNISNLSFNGKPDKQKQLENVRKIFVKNFRQIESPSKYKFYQLDTLDESYMLDMKYQLLSIRNTLSKYKNPLSYYKEMIHLVKVFKCANCFEFASIGNLMLQLNKVKSDVFALCKKGKGDIIQPLDHELVCLNVPKSKNNVMTKKNHIPFKMDKKMKIIDFWLDGKFLNAKSAKKTYKRFGINSGDEIYLMPIEQKEIDKDKLPIFRKEFNEFLLPKTKKNKTKKEV